MSVQVDWCVHCEVSDPTSVDLYILNIEFVLEMFYLELHNHISQPWNLHSYLYTHKLL